MLPLINAILFTTTYEPITPPVIEAAMLAMKAVIKKGLVCIEVKKELITTFLWIGRRLFEAARDRGRLQGARKLVPGSG